MRSVLICRAKDFETKPRDDFSKYLLFRDILLFLL